MAFIISIGQTMILYKAPWWEEPLKVWTIAWVMYSRFNGCHLSVPILNRDKADVDLPIQGMANYSETCL